MRILRQVLPPILVFVLAAVALQVYIRAAHVPKYKMASPTDVLATLADADERSDLLHALWTTSQAAAIGFAASAILGVLIAVILSSSIWIRRAFYPYTLFFQTVPIVAIAPLLIIWFEPGLVTVSIAAFIVSVFPVIANTLSGLLATDPALVDLFHLYRAGPISRLCKLRLPYALPSILTGLRIAGGLAVIGTIVSEFLVGQIGEEEGLGVRIVGAMKNGRTDVVFAAVLIASLLGLALFAFVNILSFLLLRRWHASEQEMG